MQLVVKGQGKLGRRFRWNWGDCPV